MFDNEKWAHPVELKPFAIARAPVTQAAFAGFVDEDGYAHAELWSGAGWCWRGSVGATHPLYWRREGGGWLRRDFDRWLPLEPHRPVIHVNWFEAEAYCNWAKRRLPTEAEWEAAAACDPAVAAGKRRFPWGNEPPDASQAQLDGYALGCRDVAELPRGDSACGCRQMIGNVWEWMASDFAPYPGFLVDPYREYSEPWFGTHKVLRGGAWPTRARLLRNTWRNFYEPDRRDIWAGFRTCAWRHRIFDFRRSTGWHALRYPEGRGPARNTPFGVPQDVPPSDDIIMSKNHSLPGAPLSANPLVEFGRDVLAGLTASPKRLSCRYFYDQEGSRLFEAICEQPEYYLTRAETAILREQAGAIAARFLGDVTLVELGSGNSSKTRLLLDAFLKDRRAVRYVPIDICRPVLESSAASLAKQYPRLEIVPVAAEYHEGLQLLGMEADRPKLILWLGSNIGNFERGEAAQFLRQVRDTDDRSRSPAGRSRSA